MNGPATDALEGAPVSRQPELLLCHCEWHDIGGIWLFARMGLFGSRPTDGRTSFNSSGTNVAYGFPKHRCLLRANSQSGYVAVWNMIDGTPTIPISKDVNYGESKGMFLFWTSFNSDVSSEIRRTESHLPMSTLCEELSRLQCLQAVDVDCVFS